MTIYFMPDLIDPDGEHPRYDVSSREEAIAIFDAHAKDVLAAKAKSLPGDFETNLAKLTDHAEKVLPGIRDAVGSTAEKNGFLLKSTVESKGERLLLTTDHHLRMHERMEEIKREEAASSARQSESVTHSSPRNASPQSRPASANRWLWGAGIATGGALLVHGAVAAATAVSPEDNRRDWRRTALHAAEAIAGVALSWVSIVKLRTSASPAL